MNRIAGNLLENCKIISMPNCVELLDISFKTATIYGEMCRIVENVLYNSNIFSMPPRYLSS
jgi:hypothetical protein